MKINIVKYEHDQNCAARKEKLGNHERPSSKVKEPGHDGVNFVGAPPDEMKSEKSVGNAEITTSRIATNSQGWY